MEDGQTVFIDLFLADDITSGDFSHFIPGPLGSHKKDKAFHAFSLKQMLTRAVDTVSL